MNEDKNTDLEKLSRPIPTKRYFTISEVSELCQVKPHVLRYWEQEFNKLRPNKRGNRRYYQYDEVLLVRKIRDLLYGQLFTIKGARAILGDETTGKTGLNRATFVDSPHHSSGQSQIAKSADFEDINSQTEDDDSALFFYPPSDNINQDSPPPALVNTTHLEAELRSIMRLLVANTNEVVGNN